MPDTSERSNPYEKAPLYYPPSFIRLKLSPVYLGMDKNLYNRTVRPYLTHLTRWRTLLARRSLSRGEPIGAIARSLGYESESAFSTAYKRVMGNTPRRHARLAAVLQG